jgi:acyl dehydratase
MSNPPLLHFEDFPPGSVRRFGRMDVTAQAIKAFAERFDPPLVHRDADAEAQLGLGGMVASGWHTAAMTMRMVCDEVLNRAAGLGSPGMEAVDWLRPVRPGDRLSMRVSVVGARVSRSRPDTGLVALQFETLNQADVVVMRQKGSVFFRRRPQGAAP